MRVTSKRSSSCHAAKADSVETNRWRRDLGLRAADFSTVLIRTRSAAESALHDIS